MLAIRRRISRKVAIFFVTSYQLSISQKIPIEIASKPIARNGMEGGFEERTLEFKRTLFLRKVKLKVFLERFYSSVQGLKEFIVQRTGFRDFRKEFGVIPVKVL